MLLKAIVDSRGARWIALGWSLFIGENLIMSENRSFIIEKLGSSGYHGIYNVLSTAACMSIGIGYFRYGRGKDPFPHYLATGRPSIGIVRHGIAFAIQSVGLVMFSQLLPTLQAPFQRQIEIDKTMSSEKNSQMTPASSGSRDDKSHLSIRCPLDFQGRKDKVESSRDGLFGMERVTRHAALYSLGLTFFGPAVCTRYIPECVSGIFPLVFAYIGSNHQDSRFRRSIGGYLSPERDMVTSNVPFVALMEGKQKWKDLMEEFDVSNAVAATTISAILALRRFKR